MKICAATGNAGKLRELRRILEAQGHEVVSQKELGITIEPEETGTTFAENALIKAETIRKATCVLPQHRNVKEAKTARRSAVSLLVGRRRIALFGGGVPEKPCEKETKTYWLTLPGGFSLPLGIAITGIYEYDTRDEILQEASVQQSLLGQIQTRAQRDMIAGTILDSRCRIQTADGCIWLCATLRCEEMIARMQPANLKEAIE